MKTETQVLIVGAGPTGLALAIALQQAGVDHVLIDRLEAGRNTSRAGVIHAHTLEVLEPLGVTERMLAEGLTLTRFAVRNRRRAMVSLDFSALPSRHPYVLMIPQDRTEALLEARLSELGGTVHRGVSAHGFAADAGGVTVTLAAPDGARAIRARYVVGADGMHSAVRAASGIAFPGSAYDESFVLADVRMEWSAPDEVSLFLAPEGVVVVAPLPDGSFRIVASHRAPADQPDRAAIQRLLDERGPRTGGARVTGVVWSSSFRIHHRVADAYRDGRMLLMGDAAHVHSPAGGQGMNTGLVDAVVLGRLLARVLRDGAPDATLDGYGELRRPAAEEVLALSGRLTMIATARGRARRFVRDVILGIVDRLPPARRRLMMNISGLSRRALAGI